MQIGVYFNSCFVTIRVPCAITPQRCCCKQFSGSCRSRRRGRSAIATAHLRGKLHSSSVQELVLFGTLQDLSLRSFTAISGGLGLQHLRPASTAQLWKATKKEKSRFPAFSFVCFLGGLGSPLFATAGEGFRANLMYSMVLAPALRRFGPMGFSFQRDLHSRGFQLSPVALFVPSLYSVLVRSCNSHFTFLQGAGPPVRTPHKNVPMALPRDAQCGRTASRQLQGCSRNAAALPQGCSGAAAVM